jgi:hypothetical protein
VPISFLPPQEALMGVRRVGLYALAALGLGLVLWTVAGPGLPGGPGRAEAQKGGKTKSGGSGQTDGKKAHRYEFISAGLVTAIMIDRETGKTYALASPGMERFGGPGMGGGEHAWVPIIKFEDIEDYRKWAREHTHRLRQRFEEEFPKKEKADRFEEKKKVDEPKKVFEEKKKFEERKQEFEEKTKRFDDKKREFDDKKRESSKLEQFEKRPGELTGRSRSGAPETCLRQPAWACRRS